MQRLWICPLICAIGTAFAGTALAAPGDVQRVTAEAANLRSGPSDSTTVRSTVQRGDEVLELRRQGDWLGVRVLRTGEEGWIFGNLVEQAQPSQLGTGLGEAGFQTLSPDFDRLVASMGQRLGYRLVTGVKQTGSDALRITPAREFLIYGSRDAHMAVALAVYQMWKNHQNNRPVTVEMLDERGNPYLTIKDEASGPSWSVEEPLVAER